jgi:hypothetical protein
MKTDLKWNKIEDLPIEEEQMRKVLLLTEGRLSGSTTMHIVTDYWQVFFDDRDLELNNVFDKIKRLSENCVSYGRFGERKVPFNKIKGWMYADDLINLYNGRK